MEHIYTEFEFELPVGVLHEDGTLIRTGVMRRATARDELVALADMRVRQNDAFLPVHLISSVVKKLGHYEVISPDLVANLYVEDFYFLLALYNKINKLDEPATSAPLSDTETPLGNVEALPFRMNSTKR